MSVKIIPTVLANTTAEFHERLNKLLPVANEIQVDIMDGKFVPSTSMAIEAIPDLRKWPDKRFEAHLMVENPASYLGPIASKGFSRVIFHVETLHEHVLPAVLLLCRRYRLEPVLAINPETPVAHLWPFLPKLHGVLFLGVHPGFNGAPYVKNTPARIKELVKRNNNPQLFIQVDGGMTPETIGQVVAAGATRINSGSFVSNAPDPAVAMKALYAAANKAMPTALMLVKPKSSGTLVVSKTPVKVPVKKAPLKKAPIKKTTLSTTKKTNKKITKPTKKPVVKKSKKPIKRATPVKKQKTTRKRR